MTRTGAVDGDGTLATGLHEDVSPGICPEDNALGWRMSDGEARRLVEAG